MEAFAISKHVGYPAQKVRQVADLVRGHSVEGALGILQLTSRAAAEPMAKTIKSAMHNMVNKHGGSVDTEDMFIKSIQVDEGRTLHRIRPRAQGRAFRIRKRSSHIKVIVSLAEEQEDE
jgi:large subunit ribosomal protein L22